MLLNKIQVVERHNRPGTLSRNVLRVNFINNGNYQDVTEVSSVSLFSKSANTSPSSVLASGTQLISDSAASTVKFRWTGVKDASTFNTDASSASSIYKVDTGQYAVVLDGTQVVSSTTRDGTVIKNQVSSVGEYIDVWTVKVSGSTGYQVFINEVKILPDSFVTTTEPLLLKSKSSLIPNRVYLGETINLKVPVEITVMNKNIDRTVKNTLSEGVITNAQMRILKHNEDSNLPARVEVSGYSDTSASVEITGDNTILFPFDTAVLTSGLANLGSGTGNYSVQVKYTMLDETIISPMMYFTVR